MNNDRELLELAAKAAGYDTTHHWNAERLRLDPPIIGLCIPEVSTLWNPLAYDRDALRLAVKLQIEITTYPKAGEVGAGRSANLVGYGKHGRVFEYFGKDPYAATRRAIVRAAAEIGGAL